ncbi:MAG: UvrD-helicase domain-containing protein, partial [Oscillospiraceae bacterium]|nr:UvrD-helicase domain-containing protein [Oscillospiraceae bacterium]
MDFTPSQLNSIQCRGSSVLVSAGAGSGKTRVLTERLMEYIDPQDPDTVPASIDSFVVITFTRAAAGELRGRIAAAITERLRQTPDNMHLRRQLLLSRNAKIGTIHSFCADLLREYAGRAGISPSFRILEEERAERLRAAALERVLERHYEEGNEGFLQLVSTVGAGRDDSRLAEQLLKLHAAIQSHADPSAWVAEQIALLNLDTASFGDTPWGEEILRECEKTVRFWAREMERCLAILRGDEIICKAYENSFQETADALRRVEAKCPCGWNAVRSCFPVPFPKLGGAGKESDPELKEWLQARRKSCKKAMDKLGLSFTDESAEVMAELRSSVSAMSALLSLTMELEKEFQAAKQRVNGMDFQDLEHRSLALLRTKEGDRTPLAAELAARYTEIMVDEYQDVSRVQDSLFYALSRNGKNLFFVGDVKQSIYRFRLADPTIFLEKADSFNETEPTDDETGSSLEEGRLIRLQENFRSRREVLNAVNRTFTRVMSRELGDLDYGRGDELLPGADYSGDVPIPELILLQRDQTEIGASEVEAEAVAERIRQLMQDGRVQESGTMRPLRYGDIAILLRAANTIGGTYRRVLQNNGIPVTSGTAGDFYGSIEVSTVFAMLAVMDNPHQDIPLLTLLRSPCIGFSADSLSRIRSLKPDADYYTALCLSGDPDVIRFRKILEKLRREAPDRSPTDLVERVIEELDLYAVCSAMPDGERRIRRLAGLISMAETFRQGDEYGLHRFVLWLQNMERRGQEPSSGAEGGDAVRILSIHKSKGLEFPVVFCSGLGRSFNRQDSLSTVLVHPVLGLGPRATDTVRKLEYPTAARRAIDARITRESLSEEMRLLYVAMTRAKERLILTACVRNPDDCLEEARKLVFPGPDAYGSSETVKIPAQLLQDASCPLQWVLPAVVADDAFSLVTDVITDENAESADARGDVQREADPELLKLLDRNLTWVYPHAAAQQLASKVTATDLIGLRVVDPDAVYVSPPAFPEASIRLPEPEQKSVSAARRGSAV